MRIHLAAALLVYPVAAQTAEFVPIFKADALGGQFFFDGNNTSFSGNANLLFTPAVKLSDRDMFVPTLTSQYRRTREVRELIGGGFLTQESLDTMLSLKWVRQLSQTWAVKPGLSYKNELIAEAQGETLGNGLFDYHKISAGLEAERRAQILNLRLGAAAYTVRYYHYRALAATQQDLGAEVNSGDRVLDFNGYDGVVGVDWKLGEASVLTGTFLSSVRLFREQNLVTESGAYVPTKRRDLYLLGTAGVQRQLPEWSLRRLRAENAAGMNLSFGYLQSNQDNYDASRTRFNPDYYDYSEFSLSPYYAMRLAKKFAATINYDFTRRRYVGRPVQTADGNYSSTNDRVYIHTHTVGWQFAYPIWKGLSVKVSGSYRVSASNMTYEKAYKYNYESAHYFAGLSYSL